MATAGQDVRGRTSSDFVDETILEAFVPAASQVNVQELLEAWDGEVLEDKNTIVPFIEQRQFLLLDEEVPVHIVLRTKLLDEELLEAYLARLAISLEARAYGSLHVRPDSHEKPATANELLWSGTIDPDGEPTICATEVQSEGQDEPAQYVYIFWKVTVPISRPKAKINKLSLYFTPSASLKPPTSSSTNPSKSQDLDDYLPTLTPQPPNLLAPFSSDPALNGVKPKLLASNLYRAPTNPSVKSLQQNLRSGSRRLFRAAPAFLWRLRFIPSPASAEQGVTIAALDLEITPFASSPVKIDEVHLDLKAGKVEDLTPILPKTAAPGDLFTLLYKLYPGRREDLGGNLPELTVKAEGAVLVSDVCVPRIKFTYTTPVELPTQSRPVSRAGPVLHAAGRESPKKAVGPDTLLSMTSPPSTSHGPTANINTTPLNNGLVLSITGPPSITVNTPFTWELFVINKSEKMHRLAVVAIPKRRPWVKHGSRDSVASLRGGHDAKLAQNSKRDDFAEPVQDERLVYEKQKSAVQEPTALMCLSPDVRIGPLAPGACFTATLKFVALEAGVQNLEALRIVDLTSQTQDSVDVRVLPDIVVTEDGEGEGSSEESE